jgi:carbon storage regulator
MLVLTRKADQEIVIGDDVVVKVISVSDDGRKVRIGIDAPREVPVFRREVQDEIDAGVRR